MRRIPEQDHLTPYHEAALLLMPTVEDPEQGCTADSCPTDGALPPCR